MPISAQAIIELLHMAPHPEGGWYTETYQAPAAPGVRPAISAIYFLLQQGERSRWHTVDATEIWLWHAGASLLLHLVPGVGRDPDPARAGETILLGPDLNTGERPQAIVPVGVWQSAECRQGWALVSCIVAPAFQFSGFTIAPMDWSPSGR